ncbi:MAG: hypothetical protein HON14_15265 [Rhodospirillaceae bacterium]|jgi:hypothetical protein|nr:hypothetical protein [Rhodospirillaceae bacterium]MBT4589894.1 hypothetical protein [Rhodospirillaceae bacterium]MBT4940493.1 hypothetical protein [Rhodospirillaceae bacterium]MBT5941677.1 hypothetical protein [Rhodospirillaceae bacterium]MBT7267377.1 hypothetical protein [Rhodospirillaceae bacterium]
MCTFAILRRPGHDWPVIIGANRDEMKDRPWHAPGRHWPDRLDVLAGKDDLAGGTWLGMNDFGVVAGVLNRRGSLGPKEGYRSRGELPLEILDHADAAAAAEALAEINPNAYRPFNIVFADNRDAYWLRLAETHWGPHAEVKQIPPGISLITSSDRNDVSSARIRTYLPQFEKAEIPDPISGNWSAWQSLFASRMYDPDDGPEGAMMISTDSGFGTVSSSLIALPSPEYVDANPGTKPVYMFAAGAPVDAEYLPVVA